MAPAMLPPGNISCGQRRLDGRKFSRAEVALSQQPIYRPGMNTPEKHSFCIYPLSFHVRRTGTDKYRPRCTKRYQLMGIHRQINRRQRSGIANEITRKPMVSSGGSQVLDLFTQYAAQDFGAPGTRRTNESCGY